MAALFEYYNTGSDADVYFYGALWYAQTFTPALAHILTSVKLQLYRQGSPGTITVSIRATDGSGHPTGADLASGTTNGDTLPVSPDTEWREITLGAGYELTPSTKYAIVARATSGNSSNQVRWLYDSTSATYTGGNLEESTNSGSTWAGYANYDFMFECWAAGTTVTPGVASLTTTLYTPTVTATFFIPRVFIM